jgi:hypothetical protein
MERYKNAGPAPEGLVRDLRIWAEGRRSLFSDVVIQTSGILPLQSGYNQAPKIPRISVRKFGNGIFQAFGFSSDTAEEALDHLPSIKPIFEAFHAESRARPDVRGCVVAMFVCLLSESSVPIVVPIPFVLEEGFTEPGKEIVNLKKTVLDLFKKATNLNLERSSKV